MQIYRNYLTLPESAKNTVVAMGNFDGVHIGHQQVIAVAKNIATARNVQCSALTFTPHPSTILGNNPQSLLYSLRNKIELLSTLSVHMLFLIKFSKLFSSYSAAYFIDKILVDQLKINHIVIGSNFSFGHKRSGNIASLREAAEHYGFGVTEVDPVLQNKQICSSTNIREFLRAGAVEQATQMLGSPYFISGRVIKGKQLGRTIAVPTANILLSDLIKIAFGIYAVRVRIAGANKIYDGVANIGIRPSFAENTELLEVHIFNFDQDLYGKKLQVQFVKFMREEQKFTDLTKLTLQIHHDIQIAKELLSCI